MSQLNSQYLDMVRPTYRMRNKSTFTEMEVGEGVGMDNANQGELRD